MLSGYRTVDPVTQEIIEGKLMATVDEMGLVMARTSMSPVIYEILDFACGLLTAEGELVAQMNGITLFTGTFGFQVRALIDRFGPRLVDGDILLSNDPYAGGTHSCDFAIVKPIFVEGQIVAYAINVCPLSRCRRLRSWQPCAERDLRLSGGAAAGGRQDRESRRICHRHSAYCC